MTRRPHPWSGAPTSPPLGDAGRDDREMRTVATAARWLDTLALDPLLGFVLPGAGDILGSAFGLYVVSIAVKRRLPLVVIARMLLNLAIDAILGVVPVAGDLADVAFRAHQRNAALLTARGADRRATWRDWAIVIGAAALWIGALVAAIWLASVLVRALLGALG